MARPEAEIDGSTPEGEFALGLRALRDKARLDYRSMEKLVHFASSTLSKAASGHGLPTLDVTLAYVKACNGDVLEWETRWRDLHGRQARSRRAGTDAVPSQRGSESPRRSPGQAADPDGSGEPGPELSEIPAQADPEATDRIPRHGPLDEPREMPAGRRLLAPRRQGAHRAVQDSRRASPWVVVALILVNVSLLVTLFCSTTDRRQASQTLPATTTVAASIQAFEIEEIDEPPLVLKAGAQETRWVDLRNPNVTDLVVTELIAQVKFPEDDSVVSSRNCSAEVLKISNLQGFPYRIDAKGTTRVGFKFEVAARLPEGCEGRRIPVSYTGKAIQGTIIEGRPHVG